jgi:hypothetical protein
MTDLQDLIGKHDGEKFLICGTGCSIDDFPIEFFEEWDGVTIGCNDILDRFIPDYYLNIHEEKNLLHDIKGMTQVNIQFRSPSIGVDAERTGLVSLRGTVATTMLTVAYQLGAAEIYIVGIDLKPGKDRHHFKGCSSYYFDKNHIPDMTDPIVAAGMANGETDCSHIMHPSKECELAATINFFERAFETYRAQGVKLFNLSRDSKLRGIDYLNLTGVEHDKGDDTGYESSFASL